MTATPSHKRVGLSSRLFSAALNRYIDEFKPDPLSQKQLERWSMEWDEDQDSMIEVHGDENDDKRKQEVDSVEQKERENFLVNPAHTIRGTLDIRGDYLVVSLQILCSWTPEESSPQYGQLYFSCLVTGARFLTKREVKQKQTNANNAINEADVESKTNEGATSRDKKVQEKIRVKMVSRLREDSYISKLLQLNSATKSSSTETVLPQHLELAKAKIEISPTNLEERVTVSEDVCEAIKRAVWSSAASPLDIIEILLQLPLLPTVEHASIDPSNNNGQKITTTPLANRAKLRLLEDAMCDACEKEGDDELLDDLKISDANNTTKSKDKDFSSFSTTANKAPQRKKVKSSGQR